jgi:hypothetical protein
LGAIDNLKEEQNTAKNNNKINTECKSFNDSFSKSTKLNLSCLNDSKI